MLFIFLNKNKRNAWNYWYNVIVFFSQHKNPKKQKLKKCVQILHVYTSLKWFLYCLNLWLYKKKNMGVHLKKKCIYGGTCVSILQWGKHNYMFYIYIDRWNMQIYTGKATMLKDIGVWTYTCPILTKNKPHQMSLCLQ